MRVGIRKVSLVIKIHNSNYPLEKDSWHEN